MKKTRKYFAILLALVMTLTAFPLSGLTASAAYSGDFEYEVLSETDKTCKLTGYNGEATDLVIPSALDGYTVTSIEANSFSSSHTLTSITIPESVININGFIDCIALESITVADNNPAYASENGVLLSKDKTELLQYPLAKPDLTYTVPASVRTIKAEAFYSNLKLEELIIPNGVVTIEDCALWEMMSLKTLRIPATVTYLGGAYLSSDSSEISLCGLAYFLENFEVDPENTVYSSEDGVLFNKDKTVLLQYPMGKADNDYTIPDGVEQISTAAFYNYTKNYKLMIDLIIDMSGVTPEEFFQVQSPYLKQFYDKANQLQTFSSIMIPDSVTTIGDYAFGFCTSLTSVTIPGSVTSIGDYAFYFCTSLTSITIPGSVTSIGKYAFANCNTLTSVTMLEGVTNIGEDAFYDCPSLTNVIIPSSVISIEDFAFNSCSSLTSVNIPDSVTNIGAFAFAGCDSLTSVTIGNGVTNIGERAFYTCTSLTSITIPDSVTSIGECAFDDCANLTIYGYAGSSAETYAAENNIPFVALTSVADEKTGVTIESTENYIIPENATLHIEIVAKEESQVTYNISLMQNGAAVQPTGEVTVKIPVPDTLDGEQCAVYREEADGTQVILNAVYRDGYMVFTTDVFGSFTLAKIMPPVALGDVNGDGTIDAADAVMIQRYDSGLTTLTDEQLAAADVNADGLVDAADAVKIQRYDAGLIASL